MLINVSNLAPNDSMDVVIEGDKLALPRDNAHADVMCWTARLKRF